MASAAAVSANEDKSPPRNTLGDDDGTPGRVTSGIYADDDTLPGVKGEIDEDDDEDLPAHPSRGRRSRPAVNGDADEEHAKDPLDLFGDDDDDDMGEKTTARQLDDDELDLDDEIEKAEEMQEDDQQEYVAYEKATMDMQFPRQPIPEPTDGEMYVLKVPDFMSVSPYAWDHTTFQPPTTDHHSKGPPSTTFSAYNTALSTIRWRHSPSNPSQLQSNARINRWADGSLTLQLASDPATQYEIDGNSLAPPQQNPIKPTPTSISTTLQKAAGRQGNTAMHGALEKERYDKSQEAFTYLMLPNESSSTFLVTHKLTTGLSIKQSETVQDEAILRLQASLAEAANASKVQGGSGLNMVHIEEDPEVAKQRAIKAVKQKEAQERRLANAAERAAAKNSRMGGGNRYSGLNVGMLEDDEMGDEEGGRGRSRPGQKQRHKPRRRRNSEYSDDEDFGRKRFGAGREDEYDEEDDFVAPSDEEEVVDDDDDPDDGIVESARERTPKRGREADDDDEADAPGEAAEPFTAAVRTKRRRIVEDDEDE